jgi:hypothetical protein
MVSTMIRKEGIRASINGDYTERLVTLGRLLGHSSVSQTIEYLLSVHLDKELKAANDYRKQREST